MQHPDGILKTEQPPHRTLAKRPATIRYRLFSAGEKGEHCTGLSGMSMQVLYGMIRFRDVLYFEEKENGELVLDLASKGSDTGDFLLPGNRTLSFSVVRSHGEPRLSAQEHSGMFFATFTIFQDALTWEKQRVSGVTSQLRSFCKEYSRILAITADTAMPVYLDPYFIGVMLPKMENFMKWKQCWIEQNGSLRLKHTRSGSERNAQFTTERIDELLHKTALPTGYALDSDKLNPLMLFAYPSQGLKKYEDLTDRVEAVLRLEAPHTVVDLEWLTARPGHHQGGFALSIHFCLDETGYYQQSRVIPICSIPPAVVASFTRQQP